MNFKKTIDFIKKNKVRDDNIKVAKELKCSPETVKKTLNKEPKTDLEIKIIETFTSILLERNKRKNNLIKKIGNEI